MKYLKCGCASCGTRCESISIGRLACNAILDRFPDGTLFDPGSFVVVNAMITAGDCGCWDVFDFYVDELRKNTVNRLGYTQDIVELSNR